MTYKQKFEASEHTAHYKNIATKILKEMTVLRSLVEKSPNASRRWVWELIQNAKDVHPTGGVKIKIEYNLVNDKNSQIKFRHNGKPFTADNIRFLIEQISTKDRKKDDEGKQKTTGKFGTGFLTTHLLSEKVTVTGVAKEPDLDYRKFQLQLDRSGFDIDEITEAVERAKVSVENLDETPPYYTYVDGGFNTEFLFPLQDELGLTVASAGLSDITHCVTYALIFVEEIQSIEIVPLERIYKNSSSSIDLGNGIKLRSIAIEDKKIKTAYSIAIVSNGFTSIAVPISVSNKTISILPIHENIPRLFCSFPLIGTEDFPFPAIINNPNFNPTDPRDGVFLTVGTRANPLADENKEIIKIAVQLYFELLDFAVSHNWKQLHLLAGIKDYFIAPEWIDNKWLNDTVINPIHQKLLFAEIVETADGELASILNSKDKAKYIWFPYSGDKKIRRQIWTLANYWFPHCLPKEEDVELWYQLIWKECGKLNLDTFASFIENKKDIATLAENIEGKDVFEWLNDFYELLKTEKKEYDSIINTRAIFPNQNGVLCKKAKLHKDDGSIGEDFKDILSLLLKDIRKDLIDERINIEFEPDNIKNQSSAVKEITAEITDKANDREIAKNFSPAFKKLLLWFQKYPEKSKSLFAGLYRNKHLLYNDEEILENIEKAEQMDDLLKEFQVKNVNELRQLMNKVQSSEHSLLPVTEKILASMGISSVEEWEEALKDKNIAELFSHESTPTTDMFLYAQSHIKRAKESIINHLKTLSSYDITHIEATALTILAGILKDGKPISIVARPAYNGEVIIYYGSEQDILDYEPSELWIDDGKTPRNISLGHILKKGGIVKFPI